MRKGIIVKDGVVYGGGSGGGAGIEVTYEAYRALEEAGQVQPDTAYYLTGVQAEGGFGMAPDVYDPAGHARQLQPETDERLVTESKVLVEAVNEVWAALRDKADKITHSTEEQLTGERWIDGRPFYRKVFVQGAVSGTTVRIAIGVSEIDYGMCFLDQSLSMARFTGNLTTTIAQIGPTSTADAFSYVVVPYIRMESDAIDLTWGAGMKSLESAVVTIKYLKT